MRMPKRPNPFYYDLLAIVLTMLAAAASAQDSHPPSANRPAYSSKGVISGEAVDEARGGKTLYGAPITPRTDECFPAEPRDVFWRMDKVPDPKTGKLVPLNFDENLDGKIDDRERNAIRGRNTWLLWGAGNEAFWGWLQEKGYGLTDFLILMDSRRRGSRFATAGLINQPGFISNSDPAKRVLGLYLDLPDMGIDEETGQPKVLLTPPPTEVDENGKPLARPSPPPNHPSQLFVPGDQELYDKTRKALANDGLDTDIYGYPSGIFGLRLFLNPDFFGNTPEAKQAREYWDERVVKPVHSEYYSATSPKVHSDPKLVRPFRVSMSCGFCHIGPHPLNPPLDPEKPEWENLSSIIGNQYWDPQPAFANLLTPDNFLHHFLKSQAPGTIDTSLVSTDHINNTNVINALFEVPARLTRAKQKPPEAQSRENMLLRSIEEEMPNPPNTWPKKDGERHVPAVLFPGEDSIGVFGALARVPLNIGLFSEQWARCDNPVIGYTPQRPFRIEVARANSVYWNVNEKYRVGYMAAFFTLGTSGNVAKSTAGMKLKDAGPLKVGGKLAPGPDGRVKTEGSEYLPDSEAPLRTQGRKVFLENCAICHSSKQPGGFNLLFQREMTGGWDHSPAPADAEHPVYTLPMEFGQPWEAFKHSPGYQDYVGRITAIAGKAPEGGAEDEFLKDNFLSSELRIPITLVGTYSGRAMATNAMRGNVWDNYSSETFKNLPSVGNIRYFNPFSGKPVDHYGNNDTYWDGREKGGPGYMRPVSLVSLWATAPYFHNNALGIYTHDPSVKGRMVAFEDGIRKLLWPDRRPGHARAGYTYVPPGDLRGEVKPLPEAPGWGENGYMYRLPQDTFVKFQPGFIRPLIEGLLVGYVGQEPGKILFTILSFWWWAILVLLFVLLIFKGRARHAGVFLILLALALAALLVSTGLGGYGGTMMGTLIMGMMNILEYATVWLWGVAAAIIPVGVILLLTRREWRGLARAIFIASAIVTLFIGILVNKFLNGKLKNTCPILAVLPNEWLGGDYKGINVGPIPKGTPVNLVMNLDPDKRDKAGPALAELIRALGEIQRTKLRGVAAYKVLAQRAGPAMIAASKCPDWVLDRGHYFGEILVKQDANKDERVWEKENNEAKEALIAFLKTL